MAFVLVTGATRGFGKAFCELAAKEYGTAATYVITGRSSDGLAACADAIRAASNGTPDIHCITGDLSDDSKAEELAASLMKPFDAAKHEKAVIVSNAGYVEPQNVLGTPLPLSDVQKAMSINVTSCIYLVNQVVTSVQPWKGTGKTCFLLNVSSKAAVTPFKCWAVYCAAKAARNMLFEVAATEDQGNDILRVVNYGPGVLDTDMQKEVRSRVADPDVRAFFQSMADDNKLIPPAESARKLLGLVLKNEFKQADHIDYWDINE